MLPPHLLDGGYGGGLIQQVPPLPLNSPSNVDFGNAGELVFFQSRITCDEENGKIQERYLPSLPHEFI